MSAPHDDEYHDETDSSYGDDLASSTTSVKGSILEYREVHGRTFQNTKTTEYWGPNDDKQNEQLDIGHHMLSLLLDNKLFLAPIGPNPQKVIDVGTGTGIWAIDFADAYPSGGYIESLEMDIQFLSDDGTVGPGHVMYEWSQLFIDAGEKMGRTFKISRNSKELIEAAGFVDVVEKKYKVPMGGWMKDKKDKELGMWTLLFMTEGLEGMALYILTNVLRWDYTEIQAYIGRMRTAVLDRKNHSYSEITVVYGRKPEA